MLRGIAVVDIATEVERTAETQTGILQKQSIHIFYIIIRISNLFS